MMDQEQKLNALLRLKRFEKPGVVFWNAFEEKFYQRTLETKVGVLPSITQWIQSMQLKLAGALATACVLIAGYMLKNPKFYSPYSRSLEGLVSMNCRAAKTNWDLSQGQQDCSAYKQNNNGLVVVYQNSLK